MSKQKIDLIRQALSASESSVRLARQLLNELERESGQERPMSKDLPGVMGMYDGKDMVADNGDRYPVSDNYASKSILVVGDTLKLIEDGRERRFKQIEHVKRHKTTGILTKKEGKWAAVTPEGSYKLLHVAVEHFSGDVGDEVLLQLPAKNLQVPFAAVEKIMKKESSGVKAEEKGKEDQEAKAKAKAEAEAEEVKIREVKEKETIETSKELKSKETKPKEKEEKKKEEKPSSGESMKEKKEEAKETKVTEPTKQIQETSAIAEEELR